MLHRRRCVGRYCCSPKLKPTTLAWFAPAMRVGTDSTRRGRTTGITRFTSLLFQGEEWAASTPFLYFTAHADPALGKAVSEGRRREFAAFGWNRDEVPDPQDPGTFEESKLKWEELDEPYHRRMLGWYRDLIAMRRRMPAVAQ